MNLTQEQRGALRFVAKGSSEFVEKIKYVREQLGLGLKEARDLIDMAETLTADEIVKRYKRVRQTGVYVQEDKIATVGYFIISGSFPELAGYHKTLSVWVKRFAEYNPGEIHVIELVDRREVMEQIGLMAHMKAVD